MMSTRWKFRAVCGTATVMLGGCWTPAPYGYPSNPGYYAQPAPMYQPPPGVVVSPGVTYPAPQLGPPGSPGGGTWTPSSPPQMAPVPGSPPLAPSNLGPLPGGPGPQTFGPPSGFRDSSPPRMQSDNLVPDPRDLGPASRDLGPSPRPSPPVDRPLPPLDRPAPPPTNQNSTPFGSEDGKPFEQGTQIQIPQRGADATKSIADRSEPFESPLDRGEKLDGGEKLDTGVIAVAAKTSDAKTRVETPNRFDYDRVSYSYLRGVVDYNPRDKSWHIIYSPNPDRKDKYGGAFQLVEHPKLSALHDGDVVFIQGHISSRQLDAGGKPKYEVGDEVARVTYRGTQSVGN
jgi:hypothetical protein